MLQQTRVETVIPYYERFLARFPSVEALATADEQEVLREWAGLGYYARARNLKRAAEQMVREHGGAVPRERDALAALPGVGPYTVGALRSIAFGERAPIVDGNVKRVLARLLAESSLSSTAQWSLAGDLVPARAPDEFNQALMELGATVCTPKSPDCGACPVSRDCKAHDTGDPESYPARVRRAAPPRVRAVAGVLERARPRALLMLRRPSDGLLGGLWELPSVEGDDADALVRLLHERTGLTTREAETLGSVQHAFTHRALDVRVVRLVRASGRFRRDGGAARWCEPQGLAELPLSKLTRKTLATAGHPG